MEQIGGILSTCDRAVQSDQELGLQLKSAAERGKLPEVRKLLSCGAPVVKDSNGLSAIHKAAKNGHSSVVKQLMGSRRFSVNHQDKYGWTPLHWASWNGHQSTIATLISSSRINSNITDKSGSNTLHCASLNGHSNVIKTLASAKVDLDLHRRDGWTPLHLACWNGHLETVRELLGARCKVNARTDSGMGSLHLAAAKEYDEIVQELLRTGVAPDMQDKLGNTALHEAVKWSHLTTVRILKHAGCRVNMKNSDGEMPVDVARREGYADIELELLRYGRVSSCSLYETCECSELKNMLFNYSGHKKPSELDGLKVFEDDENSLDSSFDGNKCFDYTGFKSPFRGDCNSRNSFDSTNCTESTQSRAALRKPKNQSSLDSEDRSWQEKMENARAEVIASYKSRIAEVEREYQLKVSSLEKQCSQKPSTVRRVRSDCPSQQLLTVPPRHLFGSNDSIAGAGSIHTI